MRTDGVWKNSFHLGSARRPLPGFFQHIVVLCTTVRHNKTYQQCSWIWTDPKVNLLDPGERLHDFLRAFCEPTLYILDDCSFDGVNEEKRHVVNACFLGPPCRAICQGPHSKIQLCLEGLVRADALNLFVSLQRLRFLRRLSA